MSQPEKPSGAANSRRRARAGDSRVVGVQSSVLECGERLIDLESVAEVLGGLSIQIIAAEAAYTDGIEQLIRD